MIHKGFKIFRNIKRHQRVRMWNLFYIFHYAVIGRENFSEVSNGLLMDDYIQKWRYYFYRPN